MSDFDFMPEYKCYKVVRAAVIADIDMSSDSITLAWTNVYGDVDVKKVSVDRAFFEKHSPKVGGYFIVYEDGYASYSPAKSFNECYFRVPKLVSG